MAQNNDGNESRNDVKRPRRRYSPEEKRRLLDETVVGIALASRVLGRGNEDAPTEQLELLRQLAMGAP